MLDIMDYITLRKDITFAERDFQEIDALIFSELAYVDWHNIAEGEILLPDACEQFFQENAGTDFALTYALFDPDPTAGAAAERHPALCAGAPDALSERI